MADIAYTKQYLPGYTGHVPKKNDVYGCTAGDINKIITGTGYKPSNYDVDIAVGKPSFAKREFYSNAPATDKFNDALQFGNHSKHGDNWLGGPTNNVKAQHIPGYAGYVPQIKSENIYAKSFAKTSGAAINGEFTPASQQFQTSNAADFGKDNFRRLKVAECPAQQRDLEHAANFHDAEFQGIETSNKGAHHELTTVGYSGHQSMYRKPVTKIEHRKDPFFNVNPMRPRLKDRDVRQTGEFQTLSAGFQIAMNSTKHSDNQGKPAQDQVSVPVVGYTGHRMGYRSQNFYGKNFKDASIMSKMVQKMAQ